MKVITLSLLLLCSILNASAAAVCKADDTLIPNPEDCGSFYVCDNGIPKLQLCPPTLHFNPVALVCDRPENVNCEVGQTTEVPVSSTEPTTEGPTTSETTTDGTSNVPTSEPTSTDITTEGSTNEPTSEATTEEPIGTSTPPSSIKCPSSGSAILPNPDDCASFVVCINGHNTTITCPNGMLYNDNIKTCDDAENVYCGETTTETSETSTELSTTEITSENPTTEVSTEPPTETTTEEQTTDETTDGEITTSTPPSSTECPVSGSDIIPNLKDCASFIVCIEGHNITVSCPDGMLYNNDVKTCDKPENVECNIIEITTTEVPETTQLSTTEVTNGGTEEPSVSTTESTESTPNLTTTTDEISTETPINSTTTEQPGYGPDCPEEGYAVFENPESCSSFYVCVNGNSGLVQCPAGFDYNPATVRCDLPENPHCRDGTSGTPPTVPPYVPTCPENGTILLPDPSSCGSFYICINGNYAQLSCPDDFEFNVTSQSCVHSQDSTCSIIQTYESSFQCEEDGSFPDPDDCTKYYVCVGNQVFPMECPGGLHFDVSLSTCNTPEEAQCKIGSTNPTEPTKPTVTTEVTEQSVPTSGTSTTKNPTTLKPTTSRPGNEPDCPEEGTAVLPNPDDCTQFFICIEGSYDVVDCPQGYAFNEELGRCDLAENVDCSAGTTPAPNHPNCPSTGSAKLPNPDDCGSYIYCLNGQSAIIQCPDGLNYDEEKEECSASADCSIDTTPSPKPTSTTTTKKPTTSDEPTQTSTTSDEPTQTSTTSGTPTGSPGDCTEDGQLLPNPDDCASFYMCANGIPVKIDCPPGLEFNEIALVCDNPETANCSKRRQEQSLFKFLKFWN